ncbi:MAG: hypothetical protein IPK93_03545 [Solirubrobacterales bacterium]|nr:hypothetical protein [Solirubrobacterales bacterium]
MLVGLFVLLGLSGTARATTPDQLSACKSLGQAIVKPDGSVLTAGADDSGCYPFSDFEGAPHPMLVQLKPDGSVDEGFWNGGARVFEDRGGAIELLDTGDGEAILITTQDILKIKDDGSLDPAFSGDGIVPNVDSDYLDKFHNQIGISAAGLQPDGKIVVASGQRLTRFTADGEIDNGFSGDGVAEVTAPGGADFEGIVSLAFDASGRIVVAGNAGFDQAAALRFDSDGSPDTAFGGNADGYAVTSAGGSNGVDSVFVETDGQIRIYGSGYTVIYILGSVAVLDQDGIPVPGYPQRFNAYSYSYAENGTGQVTYSGEPGRGSRPNFNVAGSGANFSLTPGDSAVSGIDYSPNDNSFIATGRAFTPCFGCGRAETLLVAVKLDGSTFQPDPDFGSGGAVLVPGNECRYGIDAAAPHLTGTNWNRCRVKPPKVRAKVKFGHIRGRRPVLAGTVRLQGRIRSCTSSVAGFR